MHWSRDISKNVVFATLCGEFATECGDFATKCGDFATKCGEFATFCGEMSRSCGCDSPRVGDSIPFLSHRCVLTTEICREFTWCPFSIRKMMKRICIQTTLCSDHSSNWSTFLFNQRSPSIHPDNIASSTNGFTRSWKSSLNAILKMKLNRMNGWSLFIQGSSSSPLPSKPKLHHHSTFTGKDFQKSTRPWNFCIQNAFETYWPADDKYSQNPQTQHTNSPKDRRQ